MMCFPDDKSDRVLPKAIFNSTALINPFQYKPFFKLFSLTETENGKAYVRKKNTSLFIRDEVGVGKTIETGIIIKEELKNNPKARILIIAPPRLCNNWQIEMREFFGLEFYNTYNRRYPQYASQLLIIPRSIIEEPSDRFKQSSILQNLNNIDIIVFDESHSLKDTDSNRHSNVKAIIENNKNNNLAVIFLTGTPIVNSYEDLTAQESLLKMNDQNQIEVTSTYQGEANIYSSIPEIVLQKIDYEEGSCQAELFGNINSNFSGYCRVGLARTASSSFYALSARLERAIKKNEFKNEFEEESDYVGDSINDQEIEQIKELKSLIDSKDNLDSLKIEEVENIIKNLENTENKKAIIFSWSLDTCEMLSKKLGENYKIYTATGETTPTAVVRTIEEFKKESKEFKILICSDAMKEGYNLQFCKILIHYDYPFTPAAIQQRIGRIYRTGNTKDIKVYNMYVDCEGSYDKRVYGEILFSKAQLINSTNDVCDVTVFPDYIEKKYKEYIKDNLDYDYKDDDEDEKKKKKVISLINKIRKNKSDTNQNLGNEEDNLQNKKLDELVEELVKCLNISDGQKNIIMGKNLKSYIKELISFLKNIRLDLNDKIELTDNTELTVLEEIKNSLEERLKNYLEEYKNKVMNINETKDGANTQQSGKLLNAFITRKIQIEGARGLFKKNDEENGQRKFIEECIRNQVKNDGNSDGSYLEKFLRIGSNYNNDDFNFSYKYLNNLEEYDRKKFVDEFVELDVLIQIKKL